MGSDTYRNDYTHYNNRGYIQSSNTRWVKIWIDFSVLLGNTPIATAGDLWARLGSAPLAPVWARLDAQLAAANADNVGVMLTPYQRFPSWTRPGYTGDNGIPADLTTNGPYGWLVSYVLLRYMPNSSGPHINAFQPLNEPNGQLQPQDSVGCACATAVQTSAALSSYWRATVGGPAIRVIAPGLQQVTTSTSTTTGWEQTLTDMLHYLSNWQKPADVPLNFAIHPYHDCWNGAGSGILGSFRLWVYLNAWDPDVWITECGSKIDDYSTYMLLPPPPATNRQAPQQAQANALSAHFNAVKNTGWAYVYMQHIINDGTSFPTGLRDWVPGDTDPNVEVGYARTSWSTWKNFAGDSTP